MDLKGVDPALIEAFIEVIKAKDATQKPVATKTVGELWTEWEPWAKRNIGSYQAVVAHRNNFARVAFGLPIGKSCTTFELPWTDLTAEVIELFRDARQREPNGRGGTVKPSSVNREITTLMSMLNWHAKVRRSITHNPIAGLKKVDETPFARKTALSPDQVKRFIEAGPPIFQDIAWVAYRCAGMRNSEARMLKKSEIDWEARVINLPPERNKNGRHRVIPFPDDVLPILERHCENSRGPLVFVNPKDPKRCDPISIKTMANWAKSAREKSGIVGFNGEAIVVHTLRHSGVTQLINDGAPESMVKAAAGMCDTIFRRYSHFQRPQQEILRRHMNQQATTPVTAPLHEERKQPKRSPVAIVRQRAEGDGEG